MTTTIRTTAQIEASLAGIRKMLDDVDAFLRDCRNTPARDDDFVVGFPQYGRFTNRRGELTTVTKCAIYTAEDRGHAMGMRVINGHGEVAVVMPYIAALDAVIDMQEDLHTQLCGCLQDLYAELVEARALDAEIAAQIEADEAEAERLDAAADEAAYYDGLDREWTAAGRAFNWDGSDEAYEQYRDAKAERDADARQDR